MKVDVTSMFFNSSIEGKTATPAWGTSIGQNSSKSCRIETDKDGVVDFIVGMAYKARTDYENLDVSKGSSNRELLMLASFEKVFVNGILLKDAKYSIILIKELSESHFGRLIVSYAPYITYRGYVNSTTINMMQQAIGCSDNGCWFVYDISVVNQDELHFAAHVVDATKPMLYKGTSRARSLEWNSMIDRNEITFFHSNKETTQVIYYGCPGSGKSFHVKSITENVDSNFVFRATFHPDTDYASFVGCYKPTSKKSVAHRNIPLYTIDELADILKNNYEKADVKTIALHSFALEYADYFNGKIAQYSKRDVVLKAGLSKDYDVEINKIVNLFGWMHEKGYFPQSSTISYEFCPQVFTKAYIQAWNNPNKDVYLIIEEINRGNCAQIFGDLFQLLDRDKETGVSEYPVKADKDLADYLKGVLGADHEGIKDGELKLPSNLIIYATMNTSDQSLFPMDSAFKRRWDWEYVPIEYGANKESYNYTITIGDKEYRWVKFLEVVNKKIYAATNSEDKQMGNFFIKKSIDAATFVNKVMFYLWNEVCKEEYGNSRNFFRREKDGKIEEFKFTDLFGTERDTILNGFMANLEVKTIDEE